MKHIRLLFVSALMLCAGMTQAQKYVGGDISLLPDYENANAKYKDNDGIAITGDMMDYFKQQGWNAMRVRLFVDPSKASAQHQNTARPAAGPVLTPTFWHRRCTTTPLTAYSS